MAYQWRRLPDAPFAPRDGAMGIVTNFGSGPAKPFVLGGWNQDEPENFTLDRTNEIWQADDIEAGAWTRRRKASQWSPRHTFGLAQEATGRTHVFGSDSQEGRYRNDHWSLTGVPTGSWRLEQDNIPWGNRILGASAFFGNKLLYLGGQSYPASIGPGNPGAVAVKHADIWGFDPANAGAGWSQQVANCPALPRSTIDHAVPFGGKLYLYGGGEYEANNHNSQVWRTVAGDIAAWEQIAVAPWAGRLYPNCLAWDNKLWLLFGFGGPSGGVHANLADCWYSADGVNWSQVADGPPARHAATAFVWNDSIIAMCGSSVSADGEPVNDVWQLRNVA